MNKKQRLNSTLQTENSPAYAGIAELWANEANLPNYNLEIVRKLSEGFSPNAKVLEFGAGIGTLAQIWAKENGIRPICVEIDPKLKNIILNRGFICYSSLNDVEEKFDLIYSSNVLEHIKDDTKALDDLYCKLKPGGILCLYLPAFHCLYSDFDRALGHYRRYGKAGLIDKLESVRFTIEKCEYADMLGFFAWLALKLKNNKILSEENNNINLRFYDQKIFPISKFLDGIGAKKIFGKNILCISRKI